MNQRLFFYTLLLMFTNLITDLPRGQAQLTPSNQTFEEQLQLDAQPPPSGDSPRSGRHGGGGSRGDCPITTTQGNDNLTIIPIVPQDNWGYTLSASPTVWLYISYPEDAIEQILTGELVVEDRSTDKKLEPKQMSVTLPQQSGIFSIALPHILEKNQEYRWYFAVNCEPDNPNSNEELEIESFIFRDNGSEDNLNVPSDHIWYDDFHEKAMLYCQNPDNDTDKDSWKTLLRLENVGLDAITNSSLICPE